MNEQELSELLTHPRFQAFVKRAAEAAAEVKVLQLRPHYDVRNKSPRIVPDGYLTYRDAAASYNRKEAWIRALVSCGTVPGGNGIIESKALARYVRTRANGPHKDRAPATTTIAHADEVSNT